MRRIAVVVAVMAVAAGCSSYNEERGRGDAPVGDRDDSAKDVINFPDQFANVATACDAYGHRIYVTTRAGGALVVIADPTCAGGEQ